MTFPTGIRSLVVLLILGISATGVRANSISEILALTYNTNPEIAATRAALRGTDEGVPQAMSSWRPEVKISTAYGVRRRDRTLSTGLEIDNTDQPQSISLEISQDLFRGFRTIAETDRARNLVAAGRANLITREQDVLLQAVTAYMNVKRERAILKLRRNNVRVLEQQQSATRDRFEVGELTRTDTAQADSRLAAAVAAETTAQGDLTKASADFVEVVGQAPGTLEAPELPLGLPVSEDVAVDMAKSNNPKVISSDFTERAARDAVDLRVGELMPVIRLNGEAGKNKDILGSDVENSEQSLTMNLSVPLYQSGEVFSRIREAKHLANQRLLEFAEVTREAQEQARSSWADLVSARARIVSLQASVNAQQVAFEGVQQEAEVGSRTLLDVLDAEQELLDARVSLVQAQRDLIVAGYQVLSATGQLTALDLGLAIDVYDPTRNFGAIKSQLFGSGILYDRK